MTKLPRKRGDLFRMAVVIGSCCLFGFTAEAADPLSVRIDQVISQTQLGPVAAPVSDLDFLRRIYLDLIGTVPTSATCRAFLADASPNKRTAVIEQLLASPEHARHMATVFDVMLMERRADKHVPTAEWRKYLFDSFRANKPYNELAKEILAADGSEGPMRPAAKFVLDREVETNTLTRDIGRVFFGMDLTCAQCHDHPAIDGYHQADYYGIYAFLNRSLLFTNKEKKVSIGEKADGDVNFTSVFTKEADKSGPQLPGELEIAEPVFNKGEEYVTAPADNVRPVPKYSRRQKLAELVGSGANRAFSRNIANRLWAQMMGRGLVEPLDVHHVDNPPSNGPLMELLTDEMVALKFDMRAFLREIALSQAYQRSSVAPTSGYAEQSQALASQVPALDAEQQKLTAAVTASQEVTSKLVESWKQAQKAAAPVAEAFNKASAVVAEAQKGADATGKALADAQKKHAERQPIATALAEAAAKATEAAGKLPDEKELAQAAQKFQAKSTALAGEVAALAKSVADLTPPATAAAEKLKASQQAADAAKTSLDASNKQLAELKATAQTARLKTQAELSGVKQVQVRLVALRTLTDYTNHLTAQNAVQSGITAAQNEFQTRKQTLDKLAAELPKRQAEMTEAQQTSEQATKALAEVRQRRDAKQVAVTTFADVVAKAEAASQKLPDDAELKQAVQSVKSRSEQLTAELAEVQKGLATQEQTTKAAADRLAAAQQALATMQTEMTTHQQMLPVLENQVKDNLVKLEAEKQATSLSFEDLAQKWSQRFLVATLRPKTPEQMCWSILQATGVLENYRSAAEGEVNKTLPIDPNVPPDAAKIAARQAAIEQHIHDKLKDTAAPFINLFGHAGGQPQRDFYATADQALFFGNAGTLTGWIAPSGNNLAARLVKLEDPKALAEELYLSVLSRLPSDAETAEVAQTLAARPTEKANVVQELAWAMITSAEFRFIP